MNWVPFLTKAIFPRYPNMQDMKSCSFLIIEIIERKQKPIAIIRPQCFIFFILFISWFFRLAKHMYLLPSHNVTFKQVNIEYQESFMHRNYNRMESIFYFFFLVQLVWSDARSVKIKVASVCEKAKKQTITKRKFSRRLARMLFYLGIKLLNVKFVLWFTRFETCSSLSQFIWYDNVLIT